MSVYVYNAKRSPIGKFKKSFANTSCRRLGYQVATSLFNDLNIKTKEVDKVYVGNVLSAGLGQNIARQILIDTGVSIDKCATSVNMVCGSGLKAVSIAYNDIVLHQAHLIIAGGVENMSMSPLLKNRLNEDANLIDHMTYDALTDVFNDYHMGITAENIALKYNITREEQDMFALSSQKKVQEAIREKKFIQEITPIKNLEGVIINQDEFPRADCDLEKLGSLKPAFKQDGTVTAGNASGINDGAAFVLIGDETINAKPLVEIIDFAEVGCEPEYMGLGPVEAINRILENNNLKLDDIDLLEINEAFASQSIAVIKELAKKHNIDEEKFNKRINVNGGAIALGHPVGASGARILITLIYELKRRKQKYGIASLCIGGGMGIAILIKNVEE